ncbi:hypothetical protein M8C21_000290, partial [Ambrosia artemisiifolia]
GIVVASLTTERQASVFDCLKSYSYKFIGASEMNKNARISDRPGEVSKRRELTETVLGHDYGMGNARWDWDVD